MLLLAVILVFFDIGVLTIMDRGLQADLTDDLQHKAAQAAGAIIDLGGSTYFDKNQLANDPGWADVSLFATTSSGTVIQSANPVSATVLPNRNAMNMAMAGHDELTRVGNGRKAFFVFSKPIYSRADIGSGRPAVVGVVQVARSLQTVSDAMNGLTTLLLAASGMALILAFLAGLWLAGRTLRPIRDSLLQQKQFVSDASHELRTPVTVIRTAAEAILRQRHPADPRVRQLAEDIVSESVQLGSLVEDLGVLAEADSRAEMRREPVDIEALLAAVAESGRIRAEAAGVQLDADLKAAGVMNGDPVRIRQLFGILLDNAAKFAPQGTAIELRAEVAEGRLTVAVADHGPGVSPTELPHIFERFYRGEAERQREGSGLGLAIAQWIAEGHGGVISVRSVEGRGAEFLVQVPLSSPVVSAQKPTR